MTGYVVYSVNSEVQTSGQTGYAGWAARVIATRAARKMILAIIYYNVSNLFAAFVENGKSVDSSVMV